MAVDGHRTAVGDLPVCVVATVTHESDSCSVSALGVDGHHAAVGDLTIVVTQEIDPESIALLCTDGHGVGIGDVTVFIVALDLNAGNTTSLCMDGEGTAIDDFTAVVVALDLDAKSIVTGTQEVEGEVTAVGDLGAIIVATLDLDTVDHCVITLGIDSHCATVGHLTAIVLSRELDPPRRGRSSVALGSGGESATVGDLTVYVSVLDMDPPSLGLTVTTVGGGGNGIAVSNVAIVSLCAEAYRVSVIVPYGSGVDFSVVAEGAKVAIGSDPPGIGVGGSFGLYRECGTILVADGTAIVTYVDAMYQSCLTRICTGGDGAAVSDIAVVCFVDVNTQSIGIVPGTCSDDGAAVGDIAFVFSVYMNALCVTTVEVTTTLRICGYRTAVGDIPFVTTIDHDTHGRSIVIADRYSLESGSVSVANDSVVVAVVVKGKSIGTSTG